MIGNFFECKADKSKKYYRFIKTDLKYSDGRQFPINEVVISDKKVNLNATDRNEIGGFYISTIEYIFRWIIRGDTLCEVIIPDDSKIYKTTSENGIYVSDKIILKNPIKMNEEEAEKLYLKSNLPEISYFKALAACAICGYIDTAMKVIGDKVNKENVDIAIKEIDDFCKRRNNENMITGNVAEDGIKKVYDKLRLI